MTSIKELIYEFEPDKKVISKLGLIGTRCSYFLLCVLALLTMSHSEEMLTKLIIGLLCICFICMIELLVFRRYSFYKRVSVYKATDDTIRGIVETAMGIEHITVNSVTSTERKRNYTRLFGSFLVGGKTTSSLDIPHKAGTSPTKLLELGGYLNA